MTSSLSPAPAGDPATATSSSTTTATSAGSGPSYSPRQSGEGTKPCSQEVLSDSLQGSRGRVVRMGQFIRRHSRRIQFVPSHHREIRDADSSRAGICGRLGLNQFSQEFAAIFPTIEDGARQKEKESRITFPINGGGGDFRSKGRRNSCPIKSMGVSGVKLKAVPISLQWESRRKSSEGSSNGGYGGAKPEAGEKRSNIFPRQGPTCKRPWFRQPPKVQIVPGILGRMLVSRTRVDHQLGGERKVREGLESDHH